MNPLPLVLFGVLWIMGLPALLAAESQENHASTFPVKFSINASVAGNFITGPLAKHTQYTSAHPSLGVFVQIKKFPYIEPGMQTGFFSYGLKVTYSATQYIARVVSIPITLAGRVPAPIQDRIILYPKIGYTFIPSILSLNHQSKWTSFQGLSPGLALNVAIFNHVAMYLEYVCLFYFDQTDLHLFHQPTAGITYTF